MTYPVVAIVNTLLERAKKKNIQDMTQLKVQKILYYAQAWYLKLNNSEQLKESLIDEYFSCWKNGPVIPSLYHRLKKYGEGSVDLIADFEVNGDNVQLVYPLVEKNSIDAFLDRILDVYGSYSGKELSDLTHQSNTAWTKAGGDTGAVILWEDMVAEINQ